MNEEKESAAKREKKVKRLNALWEAVESTCYVTNDTIMLVSRDPIAMIPFVSWQRKWETIRELLVYYYYYYYYYYYCCS
jgi:hypothetical protein